MKNDKIYKNLIISISIIVPIVVALLLFMPSKIVLFGDWTSKLPHFNAIINTSTSIFLLFSFYFIKIKKDVKLHQSLNTISFIFGSIFLVSYIIYHSSVESTSYQGNFGYIYYPTLISHILLSIVVVPFVLFAFYFALTNQINKHKKVVKYTFPIWLYVSVSGVIVYLMISPYY